MAEMKTHYGIATFIMKNTKEIKALFHLLDDPDKEIFETV